MTYAFCGMLIVAFLFIIRFGGKKFFFNKINSTRSLLELGVETEATVTESTLLPWVGDGPRAKSEGPELYVCYKFQDKNGRTFEGSIRGTQNHLFARLGDKIKITYLPNNPNFSSISSLLEEQKEILEKMVEKKLL